MRDTLLIRLRRLLARTGDGFERLEAVRFAAPWRRTDRRPGVCGPGQA